MKYSFFDKLYGSSLCIIALLLMFLLFLGEDQEMFCSCSKNYVNCKRFHVLHSGLMSMYLVFITDHLLWLVEHGYK